MIVKHAFALVLIALSMPVAAQTSPDQAAADYQLFVQSVSARQTARICARGIPGYRQQFDALYRKWSGKNGPRLRRGQAVLSEVLARKDDPNVDREHLMRVQKSVNELSQSPPNPTPLQLDEAEKARCARTLADLEAGLK
jgi:hypothetical protein